jgi:7-cyano-7-deazaguanine synthase
MSAVSLVSGGLDSSLMTVLAKEEGVEQFPLFIDYGQKSKDREWAACRAVLRQCRIRPPKRMRVGGYGLAIESGLTSPMKDIFRDAFLPGRNLLFLLCGAAYAVQNGSGAILIGLLNEATHLFPDQTKEFLLEAEKTLSIAMGRKIVVVAPLMHLFKNDVMLLAKKHGIEGTYSCHKGTQKPCGKCISCQEFLSAQKA